MKKVEIKLQTAKNLRTLIKYWVCKNKSERDCGMYACNDPKKRLLCKNCFAKKLDDELKQAIKKEVEHGFMD